MYLFSKSQGSSVYRIVDLIKTLLTVGRLIAP